MIQVADRANLRAVFFRAWERFQRQEPLDGQEQLVIQAVLRHPEYHPILEQRGRHTDRDYPSGFGALNPFLHLSLHIALEEQITLDRPPGIRAQYERLCRATGDVHVAQHRLIDCLAESLWQAERAKTVPDDRAYLYCAENA